MTFHPATSLAPPETATGQSIKRDLEAAAWLFEQLAVQSDQPADRPRIRRALEEASTTWPPGQEDRWWKWLVEASRSLGLKCQIIDCTFDQLAEMAREGARVVARIGPERQWTAIAATRGRRFHVLRPLRDQNQVWVRGRRLRSLLEVHGRDDLTRCLVLDPGLAGGDVGPATPAERTPLRRLWALLRPESGDIWIILVFALVIGMLALATPLAVETLVNTVAFGRLLQPVVILALMLLAFLSFSAAIRALQTYVVEIIQQRLFARVAADLAYRLPRAETEALDGKVGRELVNRFFDVVTVQKVCAQLLLDGITLVLGALIGMAVLSFYHPWLLGFAVVLLAMLAFAIFVLGRGAISTSIKESKKKYMIAAWLEELVSCPIAFRHSGAAEFAMDRADRLTYEYLSARKEHFRVLMRQVVFVLALQAVASTVLLGLGGWLVISGQLTLGQLVAAELIVTAIVGSFAKLGKHMESFYDLLAAIDKLGVLFDLPIERQDGLLTLPNGRPAAVRVSNATYTNPAGSLRLSNLQLQIASGERIVLTGTSGSGKSQLLDLLYGSRTPASGHVAINGLDPRDLRPDALRKYVALVRHQEIFSGTIAENVHLERPDVSTNDVRDALEQVGMLERVLALPEGLETPLVESGYPLTTSQARKLMLARAIAGRPRLLLIDELLDCFSDEDGEQLMDMLCEPTRPWTLVVVTGRSAIVQRASRVIEMGHLTPVLRQEPAHAG
jgi:putative ABC transport system ATP-binding protein